MSKNQLRALDQAMEVIVGALARAVQLTVDERSPEPAREIVAEFADIDMPDDDSILPVVTIVLLHWLDLLRDELGDRPDRVDESLTWVKDNLGNRYRLRSRCVSAALQSEDGADEISVYADGLGPDFVPAIIWLITGTVARYADGDADWLQRLHADHMPQSVKRRNAD